MSTKDVLAPLILIIIIILTKHEHARPLHCAPDVRVIPTEDNPKERLAHGNLGDNEGITPLHPFSAEFHARV